jgi:hypothetical protein
MFQRNKNSTIYADTSSSSGGGGSVGGTSSPGGSMGKTVSYVNDNPFSDTNTKPGGSYHPRRLYGRRGHTQGAQTGGGAKAGGGSYANGGFSSAGTGGFNKLATGSFTGVSGTSPSIPSISSLFTGQGAQGGAYSR